MKALSGFLLALFWVLYTTPSRAVPVLTSVSNEGIVTPGSSEIFGNTFTTDGEFSAGHYFKLGNHLSVFSGTLEIDPVFCLNTDVL